MKYINKRPEYVDGIGRYPSSGVWSAADIADDAWLAAQSLSKKVPGSPTVDFSITKPENIVLPGTSASYITASALSALVVATADTAGSDNNPQGGGVRPIIADQNSYWGIGIGDTELVAWIFNSNYYSVGVAASTSTKYAALVTWGSGTLTIELSGVGTDTLGSLPSIADTSNAVEIGHVGSDYWDGIIDHVSVWASALSAADQQAAKDYAARVHGITW